MSAKRFDITYGVWWNVMLITFGSVLFSYGVKAIAAHHGFVTGGLFGVALLINYTTDLLSPGVIFMLFNIPLFILGWWLVSRRFFFYSLYAMLVTTLAYEVLVVNLGVHDQLYAAVTSGAICGFGAGMVLRTLGSGGGLDIVAIILFQRYNIGVGKFYFVFNLLLFLVSSLFLEIDLIIASLIMVFISSVVVDYVLALFNQRKLVLVVSKKPKEIAKGIGEHLRQGATFLMGRGAWTGNEREIVMTVVNNIQLKRLEEIVFTIDDSALFIVENTFSVLGASFSRRKLY